MSTMCPSAFAALRVTLRPGIERETLLMPWLIAESVLAEAGRWLGADLPGEWSAWLDARAERIYRRHPHFRGLVSSPVGNRGRDALYRFFRHWLASRLARERRALFRRLPESFALGLPVPR